jgi:hypothetical protein
MLQRPLPAPESYKILKNRSFEGLQRYKKRCELKAEIQTLKNEARQVKDSEPDNASLLAAAIEDLPKLEAEIDRRLAVHLNANRRDAYPLSSRFEILLERVGALAITEERLKRAVELIPEPANSRSAEQKKKESARLKTRIEKKTAELEAASDPADFQWANGVPTDLFADLEYNWRSAQGRFNSPCGPTGRTLDQESEKINQLWADLNIRSAMNTERKTAPFIA